MRTAVAAWLASGAACAPMMTASPGMAAPDSPVQAGVEALTGAGAQVTTIGTTFEGRPVHLITIAGEGPVPVGERPAVLIVAGVAGEHLVGTDVALGVASKMAAEQPDLLRDRTLYIVPLVNADAQALVRAGDGLRVATNANAMPADDDQDARIDEDGPDDLDGDGVITTMRVLDPPHWLPATLVADEDDPRILRAPKDGERARYALLVEGVDDDGDGSFNEDGLGGINLDRNFPARWPEHADDAGRYALEAPAARALVDWMLEQDTIGAVIVYGVHDTITKVPTAGKFDQTGRFPQGIEEDDKPLYDAVAEVFKGITGISEAPTGEADGSFHLWSYGVYGAPTFATPVWVRPDQMKREGESAEGGGDGAGAGRAPAPAEAPPPGGMTTADIQAMVADFQNADEARQQELMAEFRAMPEALQQRIMAVAQGGQDPAASEGAAAPEGAPKKRASGDEAKWLAYSDDERDGAGFVNWTSVEHPQLGTVEVGGFVPGFRWNPPAEELDRLIDEQARFAAAVLERLPMVGAEQVTVERLGERVWRVTLTLTNTGAMETVSAIGRKVERVTPIAMRFEGDRDALLAGDRLQRVWSIPGDGGVAVGEWMIAGAAGEEVEISVRSSAAGDRTVTVTLEEVSR
ncbi:MAG: M14 family zinc carboxypeptidase [Phycisphaerales bacterium]